MKIYIDADACPVKEKVISIAKDNQIHVVLVTSFSHFSAAENPPGVETIYVDKGPDVADFRIMQLAQRNDIVITQDYGLASLCLGKGCRVLHHKGFSYTHENINQLLHSRYESAMARKGGHRTKGPKAYTEDDEDKFSRLLQETIIELSLGA